LVAEKEEFSRIVHGQYAIVLPMGNTQLLLPCDESQVSNGKKVSKGLSKLFKTKKNKPKI
jgi:hypothetical protein